MMDRIVIINDLAHPRGGASQLALDSAVAFVRRGYRVTLLCGSDGNESLEREGIEVVALGMSRLLEGNRARAMMEGLYNKRAATMVRQWVTRNDTPRTVYHVHGWSQILSPAVFSALLPVRGRMIVHAHDFFFTCPNGAMFHFGRDAPCAARPMGLSCLASACDRHGIAAKGWRVVRQGLQNGVLADYPPPLLLIHNGMARYFSRSGLSATDMTVLPNPVRPFTPTRIEAERNRAVLFVGRMEATKGIDLAAEACRRAGMTLIAVGTGAMLADLSQRYPEMEWVGQQEPAAIARFARRARLAVMPSRHIEPFGLAAVEALWSGLPVIASRDSLIADDIVAAQAGLAVNPRDLDGFAAALASLSGDDTLTRRMSIAAHQQLGAIALSPESWVEALLDAYQGYLDHGRPGLFAALRRRREDAWAEPELAVTVAGGA
ncbi:glycosyl transferase family 1 [Novosphingobium guangzhouense]|uniref:Glycosyl transferase family 1 n=2 Tax=Novosphingobium guangzhouense TaxID=1850347 RepID=A0A2K2G1B1_9SPHN|nr:glycosyl transferase family 1 [Novosphingobium guangzhouense]